MTDVQIPAGAGPPRKPSRAQQATPSQPPRRLLKNRPRKNSPKVEKTLNKFTKKWWNWYFSPRKQPKSFFGEQATTASRQGEENGTSCVPTDPSHMACTNTCTLLVGYRSLQQSGIGTSYYVVVGRVQRQDYRRARRSSSYR